MSKNAIIVILSLLLATSILLLCGGYFCTNSSNTSLKTSDTITVYKVDTIIIDRPVPQYKYINKVVTDTLYSVDSIKVQVSVPISTTVYNDTSYRAVVSGYKTSLDTVQVYPKHTITTITNTIVGQKRWCIGVQVGAGWGIYSKQPDIFVGVGISYRLF